MKAKVAGQLAGNPDLTFFLPSSVVCLIELKTTKGKLSETQAALHARLAKLGHKVHVVYAFNPLDGWEKVRAILELANQVS